MHHLGDVFDGHHLAFEHGEDFRQSDGAYLHMAERELLARDAASEIVHQVFFANGVAFHDAGLLPLEGLALENLRDAAPQELDAGLHVFFEAIGLAARKRQQARPVRGFEIVDVAAIGRGLGARLNLLDHAADHAAAAGAGEAAGVNVIAGGVQLDAHAQRAQGAALADGPFDGLGLRRRLVRDAPRVAHPAQFFRRQLDGTQSGFGGHFVFQAAYSSTPQRRSHSAAREGNRNFAVAINL